MNRPSLAAAGAVALLLVCGAVFWLSGRDSVPATAESEGSPSPPASAAAPDAEEPQPAEVAPERELPALDSPERWYRRPTLGVSLAARTSSVRTPAIADELAEPERRPELHGLALKGQQAWAAHLGSLLYPPGHPEQGRWRDSVSLEQAVEAQVAYWREMLPPGHLDEPKLHFVGKIDHGLLNQRIRSWDQTSVESSREFYDWLQAQPLDPKAYPARLWLPADPHDPDVTTRGEDMARRIRETERVNFPEDADGS